MLQLGHPRELRVSLHRTALLLIYFILQNDGYTLSYPNGNSSDLQKQILLLIQVRRSHRLLSDTSLTLSGLQHWYRLRGLTPPTALPAVACPQPELLP